MQIKFISLNYRIKTPSDIEQGELQRQLALLAMQDCAALAGFIEQATALLASASPTPDEIKLDTLLSGLNVMGRLLGGIADQAVAAIEELGEIMDEGPRGVGATFDQDGGSDPDEDVLALADILAARGAAA